jgi:hypothetical protein
MFVVCIDNFCVFYKLNASDGTFKEVHRLKTMDHADIYRYNTICKFNDSGDMVATGTSDGLLK